MRNVPCKAVPKHGEDKNHVRSQALSSEGRLFIKGAEIYEGYCGTCHQENGMGLPDAGFPPLPELVG